MRACLTNPQPDASDQLMDRRSDHTYDSNINVRLCVSITCPHHLCKGERIDVNKKINAFQVRRTTL